MLAGINTTWHGCELQKVKELPRIAGNKPSVARWGNHDANAISVCVGKRNLCHATTANTNLATQLCHKRRFPPPWQSNSSGMPKAFCYAHFYHICRSNAIRSIRIKVCGHIEQRGIIVSIVLELHIKANTTLDEYLFWSDATLE